MSFRIPFRSKKAGAKKRSPISPSLRAGFFYVFFSCLWFGFFESYLKSSGFSPEEQEQLKGTVGVLYVFGSGAVLFFILYRLFRKEYRLMAELREAHDELEKRVAARTAALTEANRALESEIAVRQRAEKAVEESRLELREYIDQMSTMNAKIGLDGTILMVNAIAQIASGLNPQELHQTNFLEGQWWAFDPEVQARVRNYFQRAIQGERIDCEEKILFAGKRVIEISFGLSPVFNEAAAVKYILAEGRDISLMKHAQRALALAQQTAHLGSWEWSTETNRMRWSEEMFRIHGLPPEDRDWSLEEILAFVHPDDQSALRVAMAGMIELRAPFQKDYRIVRASDGAARWLQGQGNVSVEDAGVIRISGTSLDITERKEAEESIRMLNRDLEERALQLETANRELEAFSYSVSHDLRAPLRGIDGFSKALEDEYCNVLDDIAKSRLHRVRAAAQRMGNLIDGLLDLSTLSRVALRAEPVDLSAMAEGIAQELREGSPQRAGGIRVAAGLAAAGDPQLLRNLLDNLLRNAWKFTRHRPEALVEFGAREMSGEKVFFVKDNGVGFNMAYAGKLFGAFQRLHSNADFEGTGIGLATCQRIVLRHGGRIWAEGEVGKGAVFFFTLSACPAVEGAR